MRGLQVAHAFQHVGESRQVGTHVGLRIHQRIPHARLGGQVDDDHGAGGLAGPEHGGPVRQVDPVKGKGVVLVEAREPGALQCGVVVFVEVVQSGHLVTVVQQPQRQGMPDEAGGTRHQNPHPSRTPSKGRELIIPGRAGTAAGGECPVTRAHALQSPKKPVSR